MASHYEQSGENGKDKVIFVNKDDYRQPIDSQLAKVDEEEEEGLILPNGDINWGCPCLGGMATGPCGQEFREAFSCFHYSESEMKGSECVELFQKMSECMSQHPDLYPMRDDDDDDEDSEKIDEALQQLADTKTKEVNTEKSDSDITEKKSTDNNSVSNAEAKS